MVRYLFLLGSYLPHASANGVCVEKIAQALVAQGHRVSCLAMKRYDDHHYSEINGVNIYRVKNLWHNRVCDWCDKHPRFMFINAIRQIALWSWRIHRLVAFPLWPLSAPLFAWKFYCRAKQICIAEKIECVIGVYQPIESLFVLKKLSKKKSNLRTVMYMYDALSDGLFPRILPQFFTRIMAYYYEKKVGAAVDCVFCLPSIKNAMVKKQSIDAKKIYEVDIPHITKQSNSLDSAAFSQEKIKLHLIYTGILDSSLRNPSYAIDAIRRINVESQFCFYGHIDTSSYFNTSKVQSKYVDIKYCGVIRYEKCQEKLLNADILINISNRDTIQVPSKIFEYMSLGKPIITFFSNIEDYSLMYLKKYPLSLLIYEDWSKIEENVTLIDQFIQKNVGAKVPFETVKSLFPRNTPEYTAKKLVELCGEKWRDE